MSKGGDSIIHLKPKQEEHLPIPEEDLVLFDEMIKGWVARRRGSRRYSKTSLDFEVSIIKNLMNYVEMAPWFWTENDFEMWCFEIGVHRELAVSTQRKYQSTIRKFLQYIQDNTKFKNIVYQKYGIEIKQICNSDNCIPHILERELKKERNALTHKQIDALFEAIDYQILEASKFNSKNFKPLQRDKALWSVKYVCGLRIGEVLNLNIDSFEANMNLPELGDYGLVHVWGKGSKGSGKKFRLVPVTDPITPSLLTWYIEKIRPYFLVNADPNEKALFLSERGTRLAMSTANRRFHDAMEWTGLDELGFTPHCLRHTSVTHKSLRFGLEANRRIHGHVFGATTQGYMHVPDEIVDKEITRVVKSDLDRILGPTNGGKK